MDVFRDRLDLLTVTHDADPPGLLRNRGYSEDDIEGIMYRNVVDFLRRAWT